MTTLAPAADLWSPRGPLAPGSVEPVRTASAHSLAFYFFLLVNATLFIRPAEIVPGLIAWPIYQTLILCCLALCFSGVLGRFTQAPLTTQPILVCVLGLMPLIVASQLVNGSLEGALESGFEFFKVVVYYVLFITLVNSPQRLRQFLFWITLFATVLVTLAVLDFHGIITLPNLTPLQDRQREALTGRELIIHRLRGTGTFNDPNELCLILVFGMALCLYWAGEQRESFLRFGWLLPLGGFAYALALTQSRGGFLALLLGIVALFYCRYGKSKALLLGALVVPVLFMLFAGRQTELSVGEQTARDRIWIWSDGLMLFRENPLFGVGFNRFSTTAGLVGHNSFLHCFTELGFLGGALFLGAFYYGFRELNRLNASGELILDPDMRRLRPYLTAAIAGYVGGMLFVSYSYALPTYAVLGLADVYLRVSPVHPPLIPQRFDGRFVARVFGLSITFLLCLYVFVRLFKGGNALA